MKKRAIIISLSFVIMILSAVILIKMDRSDSKLPVDNTKSQESIFSVSQENNYEVVGGYNLETNIFSNDIGQITRIKITPDSQTMLVATLKGEILAFTKQGGEFIRQEEKFFELDTGLEGFPRENGLTAISFGADFETSGDIFLSYTALNENGELRNRVGRLTFSREENIVKGKDFIQIYEGNIESSSAHQIQGGVSVMIEGKSHYMFPVGDAFDGSGSTDLAKDIGKILLIQRDGSNPVGERPYPENPKIQAVGIRNVYDIEFNENNLKYLLADTAGSENDKLIYGKLISENGLNNKQLNFNWNGNDVSQLLSISDLYTEGNPNMNLYQWNPTETPLDIEMIPEEFAPLFSNFSNENSFLIVIFGVTGSDQNTPGKKIALGKLVDLETQPRVALSDLIVRNDSGQNFMGQPTTVAIDNETNTIYFGDIIEGRIYKVSAISQ